MADSSKVTRAEYLSLQNTLRDLDIRLEKARKRLESLNDAAGRVDLPSEFR